MAIYYYTVHREINSDGGVTIQIYKNQSGSKELVFIKLPKDEFPKDIERIYTAIHILKGKWTYDGLFKDIFEIRDINIGRDLDSTQRKIRSMISNPSFIDGFEKESIANKENILSKIEKHIKYKETHSSSDNPFFEIYAPKNVTMSTSKSRDVVPVLSVNNLDSQSENTTMSAVSAVSAPAPAPVPAPALVKTIEQMDNNGNLNNQTIGKIIDQTVKSEGSIRSALMVMFAAIVSTGLVKYWPMIRAKFRDLINQETARRTSSPNPKSKSKSKSRTTPKPKPNPKPKSKHPLSRDVAKGKSKSKSKHKK